MDFKKFELNKVTHSVRAVQAVLQYGVGAMVDFSDQSLVTGAPETWERTEKKYDDRFARALGVDYFALPTQISYERFPEWYFCPKCRKFQSMKQWVSEYKAKTPKKIQQWDPFMVYHMQCPTCHQDLVVARIVTVCENGHLNDFPWVKWVHVKANRQICSKPELKFKTGASGTEGLEGLTIECSSCKARASLKGAFSNDCFEALDEKLQSNMFYCEGNHPFKHSKCKCNLHPRTVQRGASSVYFPLVYSSLVIPPYADKLYQKVEKSQGFEKLSNFVEVLGADESDDNTDIIKTKVESYAKIIASEIGENQNQILKILQKKFLDKNESVFSVTSVQYRLEEYQALTGQSTPTGNTMGDFSREEMNISEYHIPHIKSIALIDKMRVVNALVGFSRLTPISSRDDNGYVDIKKPETKWYPAYEVKGEGIFIEFDSNDLDVWVKNNPEVLERAELINHNYNESFIGANHSRVITPKLLMLHTLSHLLITQLSFECGYSIASLSERLYCAENSDGAEMAGIFIYTASGDCEGTLGGLVRQGRSDTFPGILKKAIANAQICSNDPVCIMSRGQGRDSLNLAACHACGLLPETCCEERNGFLDRAMIVGTYENRTIGFWNDFLTSSSL